MLFIEIQKYILEKPLPIIHPDPLHQSVVVGYFVAVWVVAVEIVSTVAGTVIAVFVLACYAVQLLY